MSMERILSSPSGVIGRDVPPGVGVFLVGSVLPHAQGQVFEFRRASAGPRFFCMATMTSADFPSGCPEGISPGKSALLLGTTAAFTSATEPEDFAVFVPAHPITSAFYAILVHQLTDFR